MYPGELTGHQDRGPATRGGLALLLERRLRLVQRPLPDVPEAVIEAVGALDDPCALVTLRQADRGRDALHREARLPQDGLGGGPVRVADADVARTWRGRGRGADGTRARTGRESRSTMPRLRSRQRSVDLTVREGEIIGLPRPDGAGRTTTLLAPTGGAATVAGCGPVRDPASVREKRGHVARSGGVDPHITVRGAGRGGLRAAGRDGRHTRLPQRGGLGAH